VKEILKSMPITIKKDDFVFYDQDLQKPYTTYNLSKLWRKASKRMGVDITFYEGTRHSFASQAVNRGVNIDLIGKFLGHQNRSSTERYAHLKIDSLKVVMWKNRMRKIKDSDKKILELSPNRPQIETGSK
jgi:integrase